MRQLRYLLLVLLRFWRSLPRRRARWLAAARKTRRIRRVRRRLPIHSQKAYAKKKAHAYAKEVTRRDLSWKSARKLLSHWERQGRAQAATSATTAAAGGKS